MSSPATRATAVQTGRPGQTAGIISFPVKAAPTGSAGRASTQGHTARPTAEALRPSVHIRPDGGVRRQATAWSGLAGEVVRIITHEPFEVAVQGPFHLLVAYERAVRPEGETTVHGLPRAPLRGFSQKLNFVPHEPPHP